MIYRFGEFRLDAERESLTDANGPVALRDHALRVLKLLLQRAPEVVTKDQILEHVWGHDALSESSVPQVIKDIRQALRDSAKSPELIVTKYGRGYQFVGFVDVEQAGEFEAASAVRPRRPRWIGWVVLLAAVGLIAALQLRSPIEEEPAAESPEQPTAEIVYPTPVLIRVVDSDNGESLSRPYAEYLSFVVNSSASTIDVSVADDDQPVPGARYLDVSLTVSEDPTRRYELQLSASSSATGEPPGTRYFARPDELVGASLDQLLAFTELGPEFSIEAGLVSHSAFATEVLLRGMAAQYAGEAKRAIALFEACLAEDPSFDFARYELAIALRRTGDYELALAELSALESRHSSDFWLKRIHNGKGVAYWRMGRYDEAEASLRLALQHAGPSQARAGVANNIALLLRDQGQFAEAELAAREAVRLADREHYPTTAASALNTLASILMRTGRLGEAKAPLNEARELFYAAGNRSSHASVLSRTADVHRRLGEYAQAEQLLRLVIGIREQIDDRLGLAASMLDLARIARTRGAFSESRDLSRRALDLASAKSETYLLSKANIVLGQLALAERRGSDAMIYADEALRLAKARREPDLILQVELLRMRIAVQADSGRDATVSHLAALAQLMTQAEELGDPGWIGELTLLRGELHSQSDNQHAASIDYASALALGQTSDLNSLQVRALLAQARTSLIEDPTDSASRLESAKALNPPDYPYLVLLAQVKSALGDTSDALKLAHQAKQQSGDWWQPQDEKILTDLIAAQQPR